jgi:hypothetical protein
MSAAGGIMQGASSVQDSITGSIIQGQQMLSDQQKTAELLRQGKWGRKMAEDEFSLKKLLNMQDYNERQGKIDRAKQLRDLLASGSY